MKYKQYLLEVIEKGEPKISILKKLQHAKRFFNDCCDIEKACYRRNGYNRENEIRNAKIILSNIKE